MRTVMVVVAAASWAVATGVAPCRGQAMPIAAPMLGAAGQPSFVSETIGWSTAATRSLADSPLSSLRVRPAWGIGSEWAPLYRGHDGARLEQARQTAQFTTPAGALVVAADLRHETGTMRGGGDDWGIGVSGPVLRTGTVAVAMHASRYALAVAGTAADDGRPGVGIESQVRVARWSFGAQASDLPRSGDFDARWEDYAVAAHGSWRDRGVAMRTDGALGAEHIAASVEWFERTPLRDPSQFDAFQPRVDYRSARALWTHVFRRASVSAGYRRSDGDQRLVVARRDQPYLVVAGPVGEDAATIALAPRHERWEVRAWLGRSHDVASGSLALWPFDAVAAVAGTRYIAHSDLLLRHAGLALDGRPVPDQGWDGGAALWVLEPTGGYTAWRGTVYGLGHDGATGKALDWPRTFLAGLRVARTQALGRLRMRIEAVQWVPLPVTHRQRTPVTANPAPPPEAQPDAAPAGQTRVWGGTVLRFAIGLPWFTASPASGSP
jgi:hypothetical protein